MLDGVYDLVGGMGIELRSMGDSKDTFSRTGCSS